LEPPDAEDDCMTIKGLRVMQAFPAPGKSIDASPVGNDWKQRSTKEAMIIFGLALAT
jgi:hypothetical protein